MDISVSSYLDGEGLGYTVKLACAGQYIGNEINFYVRSQKTKDGFLLIMESVSGAGRVVV